MVPITLDASFGKKYWKRNDNQCSYNKWIVHLHNLHYSESDELELLNDTESRILSIVTGWFLFLLFLVTRSSSSVSEIAKTFRLVTLNDLVGVTESDEPEQDWSVEVVGVTDREWDRLEREDVGITNWLSFLFQYFFPKEASSVIGTTSSSICSG